MWDRSRASQYTSSRATTLFGRSRCGNAGDPVADLPGPPGGGTLGMKIKLFSGTRQRAWRAWKEQVPPWGESWMWMWMCRTFPLVGMACWFGLVLRVFSSPGGKNQRMPMDEPAGAALPIGLGIWGINGDLSRVPPRPEDTAGSWSQSENHVVADSACDGPNG